ncbi:MAG: hypothetical protein JKY22_04075 [Flavobacteriaceae bacterium]|nr:hypothetical protein [Flavobacteriaceae bacterium]
MVSASEPCLLESKKMYSKEYYHNGQIKAEGWEMGNMKMGYWKFYHINGKLVSEGHFKKNKKNKYWHFYNEKGELTKEGHYLIGSAENWWIFYDIANATTSKFQYKNNKKNGFCLRYKKGKLIKTEKYTNNIKVGEWTSYISFKRDNPGVSF